MILTKNRENINQSKLKLLDRMEKVHGPGSVSNNSQKLLLNGSTREDGQSRPSIYMNDVLIEESKGPESKKFEDVINYDYSTKTNIMLVSLTDFCPYFCST